MRQTGLLIAKTASLLSLSPLALSAQHAPPRPLSPTPPQAPARRLTPVQECQRARPAGNETYDRLWEKFAALAPLNTATTQASYQTQARQMLAREFSQMPHAVQLAVVVRYLEDEALDEANFSETSYDSDNSDAKLCERALARIQAGDTKTVFINLFKGPTLTPQEATFDKVLRQQFRATYAHRRIQALRDFNAIKGSFELKLDSTALSSPAALKQNVQIRQWEIESQKLAASMRGKRQGLTDAEIVAIHGYTMQDYGQLKAVLGNSPAAATPYRPYIELLNGALDKLPLWRSPIVTRYAATSSLEPEFIKMHRQGQTLTFPAYLSTSALSLLAAMIGSDGVAEGDKEFIYTIKQRSGRYIGQFSHAPAENEVLFKPGTRFRILSVKPRPDGKRIDIKMEEIEAKPSANP